MSNLGYIQMSLKDPLLSVSLFCHLASIILCALILSETLALYKSFTYLLTYLPGIKPPTIADLCHWTVALRRLWLASCVERGRRNPLQRRQTVQTVAAPITHLGDSCRLEWPLAAGTRSTSCWESSDVCNDEADCTPSPFYSSLTICKLHAILCTELKLEFDAIKKIKQFVHILDSFLSSKCIEMGLKLQPKITKPPHLWNYRSFKVIDFGTPGKFISSTCYDRANPCLNLSATVFTLNEPIAVK